MTIVVGALCQNGVVLGADSSATFTAGRMPTIEQPTCDKILIVTNDVLLAGTGQIGMRQRFKYVIEQNRKFLHDASAIHAVTLIAQAALKNFMLTNAEKGSFGALLAFYANNQFNLCEFAVADFQPELKTSDSWFVSMGSGQPIADPFLALLRKVLWKDKLPSVDDAIFGVAWVLDHAIEVNPGGIKGPARIATLSKSGKMPVAAFVEEDDLQEHLNNIEGLQAHLQGWFEELNGRGAHRASAPPEPPAARAT